MSLSLNPARWPIALRLAAVLTAATLLPMLVLGYINLQASIESVKAAETRTLRQLAVTTAGRLDQFIRDTRHLVTYFTWSTVVQNAVAGGAKNAAAARELSEVMVRLLEANEDIELVMVLDRQGRVQAASKPEYVGRDLSFRDYFKEASAGRDYLSPLEIGTASGKPGLYIAMPVRLSGLVAGVAVMKMHGETIAALIDATRDGERHPFLVDGDGVIVLHDDPGLRYRSLMPLTREKQERITAERRFGDVPLSSLDVPELAQALYYLPEARALDYARDGEMRIAGISPLTMHNWNVVVEESHDTFAKPLVDLYVRLAWSALGIAFFAVLFAVIFARTFVQPIKRLAKAALAVEAGQYEAARVSEHGQDELAALSKTFNQMVTGIVARERERDIFGRMVSPDVREKLLSGSLTLGGENRRVSVLFSDIRGFSTLSESMSPQDVVAFLNDYLTAMTEAVKPFGGYINNFIGDAIVVVFGAPQSLDDIEWRAVAAAMAMKERLTQLNIARRSMGDIELATGIGISTGKVVAGQVGSLERFLYTVIGDAVNIAARLEAMTKDVAGNPILVNAATWEGVRDRREFAGTDLGPLAVKGRREPVHVYALVPTIETDADTTNSGSV
jgi:adenylate cyclase